VAREPRGAADGVALVAEGLSFGYPGAQLLFQDLTLAFPRGAFTAVVGPNGSGKSTLLHLLTGAVRPSTGRVRVLGADLSSLAGRELARRVAVVPQDFFIHFPFTTREVVMMGRHAHVGRFGSPGAADFEAVDRALAELGLEDMAEAPVTRLSGGERQRVVVARALAQATPVLLLDEATSNLDIHHALDILGRIRRRVREEGTTVIAVMHDLNLAAAYADRCAFLNRGRVAEEGTTGDVFRADAIRRVFGVDARVTRDPGNGALQATFSPPAEGDPGHG